MQRRDFARTLLLGAGAACTTVIPASRTALAADATGTLHARLAREQFRDGFRQWVPIEQCNADGCAIAPRLRMDVESIDFAPIAEPLVVDAMFDTQAGLQPFRIAGFQPDSPSPLSKPFSFELSHAGLAGFRVELGTRERGSLQIGGVAASAPTHPTLTPGRYRLMLARSAGGFDADTPTSAAKLIFSVVDPTIG